MRIAAFIILYFSVATYGFGASFDCLKALTPVEIQICSDAELSVLDEKLSTAYQRSISSSSNRADIISTQKHWLQDRRNRCNDPACIKRAYEERLLILELGYDISGCYIDEHLIDIMNIDEHKAEKVSDYLDLVKLDDSRYKFFLNITRRN
ncbi:MAG: lysozyme inhibitor LprI family protein, partial [Pseudomonadota bacterium]